MSLENNSRGGGDVLHFGWVALAASFFINFIVDGYSLLYGYVRLFIEDDYRDYPSWAVASIGGILVAVTLTLAPICIAISEFFSPTRVIIVSSLLATLAFFLTWVNGFLQLGFYFDLLTLGIFQGLSGALLYGPSIAIIAQYFPPHQRSLAAGITTCGSSAGAIFYSLFTPSLFETYGWRGSMLIFGSISLNGVIAAFAFLDRLNPSKNNKWTSNSISNEPEAKQQSPEAPLLLLSPSSGTAERPPDDSESVPIPPCYILQKILEDKRRSRLDTNHSLDNAIITRENILIRMSADEQAEEDDEDSLDISINVSNRPGLSAVKKRSETEMSRKEHPNPLAQNEPPPSPKAAKPSSAQQQQQQSFVGVLKRYFDATLLCQWSFLCLLGAAAFSAIGYYIPTLLVTAQSRNPNCRVSPSVQTNLLFIWAIFNTIGRIVSGRLGDLGLKHACFTSFSIFIVGHAISAIALLIFPNTMHFGDVAFISFIAIYGFFIAPLITMRSVIVADMYGQENANATFGWFLAIQGLVQIIGFALPTWLDTLSSTYAYGFGAACFLMTSILIAFTYQPYFKMRRKVINKEIT